MSNLRRRLPALSLVILLAALASALAGEAGYYPASRSRMFAAKPEGAFRTLIATLKDLGFRIDAIERETGRAQTVAVRCNAKPLKGLDIAIPESPNLHTPFECKRVTVYAFVSPFAEPARVQISSRIEFEAKRSRRPAHRDHDEVLGSHLFERFEETIALRGHPIPRDHASRHEQARQLFIGRGWDLPECLQRELQVKNPELEKVENPSPRLPGFQPPIIFPGLELYKGQQGNLKVHARMLEDGSLSYHGILEDSTPERTQFLTVARNHALFGRYVPLDVEGCPAVTNLSILYRFRIKK